jgi:hypothetical protein
MNINRLADDELYSVALDGGRTRSMVMLGREIKAADPAEFFAIDEGEAPPADHVRVSSGRRSILVWRDPTRPELRVQPAVASTTMQQPKSAISEPVLADTPVTAAITGSSKTLRNLNWS